MSAASTAGDRRYRVTHRTEYRYDVAMADGYTVAHLLPRDTPTQRVESSLVSVDPEPFEIDEYADAFGNRVTQFGVHRPHDQLVVEAVSTVSVSEPGPLDDGMPWPLVAELVAGARDDEALTVAPFRAASQFVDLRRLGARFHELAAPSFTPDRGVVAVARDLCHRIFTDFVFDPTSTDMSTPLADVLVGRRGVCQDFAHLATACLRSFGLAARYVSGYIETVPPAGRPRMIGADMSHAWCSVWTPDAGWIDFDPTNDHLPAVRHVTVGWGRDYADLSPVRGVVIGPRAGQSLEVSVDVAPV
ncbi:MAG: transglutaminase family protein [Ilumatobacter sp.]|nr:MAG: transglutaminase family protein [Ilumatobacter sp.]